MLRAISGTDTFARRCRARSGRGRGPTLRPARRRRCSSSKMALTFRLDPIRPAYRCGRRTTAFRAEASWLVAAGDDGDERVAVERVAGQFGVDVADDPGLQTVGNRSAERWSARSSITSTRKSNPTASLRQRLPDVPGPDDQQHRRRPQVLAEHLSRRPSNSYVDGVLGRPVGGDAVGQIGERGCRRPGRPGRRRCPSRRRRSGRRPSRNPGRARSGRPAGLPAGSRPASRSRGGGPRPRRTRRRACRGCARRPGRASPPPASAACSPWSPPPYTRPPAPRQRNGGRPRRPMFSSPAHHTGRSAAVGGGDSRRPPADRPGICDRSVARPARRP